MDETMDVRKKLVELLEPHMSGLACEYESGSCELTSCRSCNARNIADHLIAHGVTVQEQDGCEYCNGLPFSQMEDFTMPNASKKDYDIVTIRYCPMCGRRLPQPPKGE